MNQRHPLNYASPEHRFPPIGTASLAIGILTCIADVWLVVHGLSDVNIDVALLLPTAAIVGMVTGRMAKSASHHEAAGIGWTVSFLALIGSVPTVGIAALFWILPRC